MYIFTFLSSSFKRFHLERTCQYSLKHKFFNLFAAFKFSPLFIKFVYVYLVCRGSLLTYNQIERSMVISVRQTVLPW